MPRVLIPSNDDDRGLVEAYRSLGWDVVVGLANFKNCASSFEVIHHQWPEEYSGWQVPTTEQICEIERNLRWWSSRATNIVTVHNLYPHHAVGHPAYHQLYSAFYHHCHLISHFSNTSHRLVLREFAAARDARHIIHCPMNYETALAAQTQRGSRRAALGIGDDEFVILMIGRIRSWDEAKLIQRAFDRAKINNKRLLMIEKLHLAGSSFHRRYLMAQWAWWRKTRSAVVETSYVPEHDLSRFLNSVT